MGSVVAELITGSSLQSACICAAIFLLLAWLARTKRYACPIPPGPWGVPFFGYLPQMAMAAKRRGQQPHEVFDDLAAKYGNMFSLKMGTKLVVVLNDFESIKQAFQSNDLNDRPTNTMTVGMTNIGKGVGYSNGDQWKELRRLSFNIFRSLGVGKTTFEQKIVEEAQILNNEFAQLKGAPLDIHEIVEYATTNVISSILLGKRFDYDDEQLKHQLDLQHRNTKIIGAGAVLIVMPAALGFLAAKARETYVKNLLGILNFHDEIVRDHQKSFDPHDLRDFIDVYLLEMQKNKENDVESYLTHENLVMTLGNIFFAATGTSCEALTWAIMFVTAYPEIQKRVHEEIDHVVGTSRLPRLCDRCDMPYTQAVIMESMRLGTLVPLGVPHVAAKDTTVLGYTIPEGSLLMPNFWSVHHSEKHWENPQTFNPDRFISPEGKLVQRPELIPFGIGRRMCLGEQLARSELFILFSHLLHRFTFTNPEDDPPIQTKGVFSANYVSAPFRVCTTERHH